MQSGNQFCYFLPTVTQHPCPDHHTPERYRYIIRLWERNVIVSDDDLSGHCYTVTFIFFSLLLLLLLYIMYYANRGGIFSTAGPIQSDTPTTVSPLRRDFTYCCIYRYIHVGTRCIVRSSHIYTRFVISYLYNIIIIVWPVFFPGR